jgi:cell division protein FtsQ
LARWLGLATLAAVGLAVGASAATGLLPQPDLAPPFEWIRGESFQLRTVEVLGLEVLDSESLVASTGLRAGTPLIEVDLERATEAIRSHPRVASCRSAHLPPDRLLFEIEERVPVAALAGGAEGIDLSGERFPLVAGESEALPRLRGDPAAALPLIAAARAAGADLSEIEVVANGETRFRLAGETLWIRSRTDPGRAIADWRRLEASGQLERFSARELDLRFRGNAVLVGVGEL